MDNVASVPTHPDEDALVAAVHSGHEQAFRELFEPHRAELQIHCYRIVGSFDDSEDLVQETLLRAWRKRETYQARATFRAWLYKIATNACLDFLDRRPRQPLPYDPTESGAPPASVPWLQPYPDSLLDRAGDTPEAVAERRETISLAFLVALQHLPARQRAVLILRDVLGWPARETAAALDTSVASVNSSLQRARPVLRQHLPGHRLDWSAGTGPTASERAVLERYLAALARADDSALAALLAAEARCGHQPHAGGHGGAEPIWYQGRDTLISAWAPALHGKDALEFQFRALPVNRQPSGAAYIRPRDSGAGFMPFALQVFDIVDGRVTELTVFAPDLLGRFGLPPSLPAS